MGAPLHLHLHLRLHLHPPRRRRERLAFAQTGLMEDPPSPPYFAAMVTRQVVVAPPAPANSFSEVALADQRFRHDEAAKPTDPLAEATALRWLLTDAAAAATCTAKLGGRWAACLRTWARLEVLGRASERRRAARREASARKRARSFETRAPKDSPEGKRPFGKAREAMRRERKKTRKKGNVRSETRAKL